MARAFDMFMLVFYLVGSLIFGVGMLVTLPLFESSVQLKNSTNATVDKALDSFVVIIIANVGGICVFGILTLCSALLGNISYERDLKYPQKPLLFIGALSAANGVMVTYAASGSRTPPFLQPVVVNMNLPITMLARYVFLHKKPTLYKLLCALGVLIGLFICVIPEMIPSLTPKAENEATSTGWKAIIWSILFMLATVPGTLSMVFNEKYLKDEMDSAREVNIFYYNFVSGLYQFIFTIMFFWTDLIPHYGYADNIDDFGHNMKFGIQCFFAQGGCNASSFVRGSLFILSYALANTFLCYLNRYTEGAVIVIITMNLETPLGFLFWTLFSENPFKFDFNPTISTLFAIIGLVFLVPSAIAYNLMPEFEDEGNYNEQRESLIQGYSIN